MQLVNQSLFMKAYRMSGGIAPLINPGIRRGRVVSFEHWPLCASEEALGNHSVEGFIGRTAGLDTVSSDWSCRQASSSGTKGSRCTDYVITAPHNTKYAKEDEKSTQNFSTET